MNITLYSYIGPREKVDKSGDLVLVTTATGEFKAQVSVLNPTLLLALPLQGQQPLIDENVDELEDIVVGEGDGLLDFNYLYIEEFRRYYNVTGISVSSNNLLIVSCEVDALFSFCDQIKENYAMIERNEYEYDTMQEDTLLPLNMVTSVTEYEPTQGQEVNTTFTATFAQQTDNIVIVTSQPSAWPQSISNDFGAPNIDSDKFSDLGGTLIFATDETQAYQVIAALCSEYSTYDTFFKGIIAYPFILDEEYGTEVSISVLKYENNTWVSEQLPASGFYHPSMSKYRVVADFILPAASNYLELNPYSHYEIFIPFYGWHEIHEYNAIHGDNLILYYAVNYADGSAQAVLWDKTKQRQLFSVPCQVGVNIALTSSNAKEKEDQKNAATLNLVLGLIGSGVGVVGSAATGNVLGAVGSGLSAVQQVTNYINKTAMLYDTSKSTPNGSAGSLYSPLTPRLKISKVTARDDLSMDDFAREFGRPLRKVRQLKTLSGYTQVSELHLDCSALDTEKAIIESSLKAGVIL